MGRIESGDKQTSEEWEKKNAIYTMLSRVQKQQDQSKNIFLLSTSQVLDMADMMSKQKVSKKS